MTRPDDRDVFLRDLLNQLNGIVKLIEEEVYPHYAEDALERMRAFNQNQAIEQFEAVNKPSTGLDEALVKLGEIL